MFSTFYIDQIQKESATIQSFYLKPKDGKPLLTYLPGQFISLKINDSEGETIARNYTLSDAPNKEHYRLSIKRESLGKVSRHFHDVFTVGSELEVSEPMGKFHLNTTINKPVIFLSGGVGITPMMSMLEYISTQQLQRKVHFIHSSLNKEVQPFFERLTHLKKQLSNMELTVFHTDALATEKIGVDYDYEGYVSQNTLAKTVELEGDYFLCGPVSFMEAMFQHLLDLGISETNISYEFFGEDKPLGRKPSFKDSNITEAHKVIFTTSDLETEWNAESQNILELAESEGLTPVNSCRMGTCSSCESTLVSGTIEYDPEPFMEAEQGKIFICCAKPTSDIQIEI
jgi:hypothetical protein